MKDEHKLIIVGISVAASIYGLHVVLAPLLRPEASAWQWLVSNLPGYTIPAVFGVVAYRTLVKSRRARDSSQRAERATALRNQIAEIFLTKPEENVYQEALQVVLDATGSKDGLLGYVNRDGDLACPSLRAEGEGRGDTVAKTRVFPRKDWGDLWNRALLEKDTQCTNQTSQVTEGYIQLERALVAPVIHENETIGLLTVGNKPADYDDTDLELLGSVSGYLGPIQAARLSKVDTARQESGDERQKMQVQLLRGEKMEDIGILAGQIAHELNIWMATIREHGDASLDKTIQHIHDACVRSVNLSRQLLLLSERHPVKVSPIDLNITTHRMLKLLGHFAGDDIEVNASLEPDLWTVQADGSGIEQVIMNLMINARDAMSEGGHIRIKTENVTFREGEWELVPGARAGKFVCVSITDEGTGIKKEAVQQIFEPFFTTRRAENASGLGLSVAQGLVKQHEGWISVYSEPGRGSTFKIYLPAVSIMSERADDSPVGISDVRGQGERILVVEDEDEIREMVTAVLSESGYVPIDAPGSNEALAIFRRENGEFDLLFSDVVLPDEDGIRLAERLLALKPDLPVLLTSGYMDEEAQWVITCEKGFEFLRKPFNIREVLRVIRRILESSKARAEMFGSSPRV
ncbi:MAG: ATP-binding protein [Candidatus Eisenbacteria bacterium]